MSTTADKTQMLDNLRAMLRDVFQLRTDGVAYARLARAHGYVDGYMRVLLETGIADKNELLASGRRRARDRRRSRDGHHRARRRHRRCLIGLLVRRGSAHRATAAPSRVYPSRAEMSSKRTFPPNRIHQAPPNVRVMDICAAGARSVQDC